MTSQIPDTKDRETPSRGGADASRARRQRWTVGVVTTLLVAAYLAILLPWLAQRHAEGWAGLLYHGVTDEDVPVAEVPMASWFLGAPGQVRAVLPGSPAARAGIEVDDRVVSISGAPIADGEALADLARRLHRGDRVTYELADGRRAEVILVSPLRLPGIGFALVVSALVGFAFLAISLLVARAKPGSRQALIFYLSSTTLAVLFFALSITELQNQGSRGIRPLEVQGLASLPSVAVYVLLLTVAANLLLHLVLIFPRPRPVLERRPQLLLWLHSLPLLPFAGLFVFILGGASTGNPAARWTVQLAAGAVLVAALLGLRRGARRLGSRQAVLARPFVSQVAALAGAVLAGTLVRNLPDGMLLVFSVLLFLSVFIWYVLVAPLLFTALTVITLVRSYRNGDIEEKRQLRWPVWGTSVALVGSTVLGLLLFVLAKLMPEIYAQTWCAATLIAVIKGLYVLIPLSFAFAIVKYRLMDIDLLLRKTAVYAAMSAFVVAAFLLLVGGLGVALVAWTGVQNQVVTVVATLLLVAVFVPVRNRVQAVVDRRYGSGAPDRDQALAALRREVLTADDLEALLPRLAETVQQTLGSRAVVLFVLPVHGGALEARAKVGVPDEVLGALRIDAGPLAAAGRVVERDASTLDDDDRAALRRLRLRWLAPARRGGEVVAAVAAGRHLDGSDPDGDELDFLAAVADQLALAVATLGRRREAVELDQARELQRSLLPAALPQPAGAELAALWQPAREVAGDYYDALDFGAEGTALCIGDVVGKGMPAALLMASLQAAVRAVASPSVEPAKLCEQVRRVVCQSLTGGRFVTFFYAFLRPGEGGSGLRLTYTNAGHVPPLLHRAGGADGGATETGAVERLEAGGGAFVRLLADTPLSGGEVELAPGDRLLLFTDGVSEAQSADGEMYGEARVEALLRAAGDLPAAELANRVAADVSRFAAGEPADDLTLLVLRAT